MKTLNKTYSYFHFEVNKIQNLRPYLSIDLSNSKSTGSICFGITDNQTTFYMRVEISKTGKISKQDKFYLVKRDKYSTIEYFFVTELNDGEEVHLTVENNKILFSDIISFNSLCLFHRQNKDLAILDNKRKQIEREKLEKERDEYYHAKEKENEKQNKSEEIFKYSYLEILGEFDGMLDDYGNQDLAVPEHLESKFNGDISVFTESEAKEILLYHGVDIELFINEYIEENI